ncbi:MAG TPA: YkgJ family cysteine cluster protein [Planctomycetaceae bacterium]|nr:YkgJ family cysteine cluster protein [Planctomycetaceae bacterium]
MGICDGCHAGCCRTFAVPVTGADIIRICRATGLSFWDFVCRWADSDGHIAKDIAPHFHFPDDPQTPFVIALAHTASEVFPRTTKCRFLLECLPDPTHPLGQGRCQVYAHRPAACRAFPTKFDETGELALLQPVPEHARDANEPVYRLCPRPWEPADLDPVETPQSLAVLRYEMAFFGKVADLWNRSPLPWSAFPEFLEFVYSRRILPTASDEAEPSEAFILPLPRPGGTFRAKAA